MKSTRKKTFVLVHGAWHGGWVWRDVLNRLRSLGHIATAPTLTGLGERRHAGNDIADLETHVEDVVARVEMENLQDITLGHVDGFDQNEAASKGDEGAIILRSFLAA